MSKNAINAYYQLNFDLAKCLCIKSEDSARLLNTYLQKTYSDLSIDEGDLSTWKYYMNICGLYHEVDTPMEVISLDTLESIEFTKEQLEIHTATKAAYSYGTRYYYSLINQYPDQEQLILGILYPADMDLAISAPDNSILSYPSSLIEDQEVTLLKELQAYIYSYNDRWKIDAYILLDSFYLPAHHAIMYLNILTKLINLRLKRCKTNEAHSFHIKQYLASHFGLDAYYNQLTLEQILFLYRNIKYIRKYSGKKFIFKWLVDELLTKRNIPISEYIMKLTDDFNTKFKSEPMFKTNPLNTIKNASINNEFSFDQFASVEYDLAPDNYSELYINHDDIKSVLQNSPSATVKTKTLISNMIDNTGSSPHQLTDILLKEWMHLSSLGIYRSLVSFTDPISAAPYSLNAEDAFLYIFYVYCKAAQIPMEHIPDFRIRKLRKLTLPLATDIIKVCSRDNAGAYDIAIKVLGTHPVRMECVSTTDFKNLCTNIYNAGLEEWYQISSRHYQRFRAELSLALNQIYTNELVHFNAAGEVYTEWLVTRNLPDPNYTLDEFTTLIEAIFTAACGGSKIKSQLMDEIQSTMIDILGTLSSYSIQVARKINANTITPFEYYLVSLQDPKALHHGNFTVKADNIRIESFETKLMNDVGYVDTGAHITFSQWKFNAFDIDLGINVEQIAAFNNTIDVPVITVGPTLSTENDFSNFNDLTIDQIKSIPLTIPTIN